MKINKRKLLIALSAACMSPQSLCEKAGIAYRTYLRIISGGNCKTITLGRIAKALNVPVTDILEDE